MGIIINPNKMDPRDDGPKPIKKTKAVTYEHQKVLNQLLKTIATCPMDQELKTVLRMRVWGRDPVVFNPLSHRQIAMLLKTKTKNVKRWEEDALWNLEQYLDKSHIVTIQEKFLKDGNLKQIAEERKRIIV